MKKVCLLAITIAMALPAHAQTYTYSTLVSFPATSKKGPIAPQNLIIDSSGNLYGLSSLGGTNNLGTVYKVTPKGVLTVLHSFSGPDGSFVATYNPDPAPLDATITRDSKGNIYGTTPFGGDLDPTCFDPEGCGTVFKMTLGSNGTYTLTTLHSGPDAEYPTGVVLDKSGNVYGVAFYGNHEIFWRGNLFEISSSGVYTDLWDFCQIDGEDGCNPTGSPILTSNGTLYGVTSGGGFFHDCTESESGGMGVVFTTTPPYTYVYAAYTFAGDVYYDEGCGPADGATPLGKPTQNAQGDWYVTTEYGGVNGAGTVEGLYNFCSQLNCVDGMNPSGPVVLDSSGNIYGVAPKGGANGHGVVFKITPVGQYSVIYNGGAAGVGNAVVLDKSGNLYGTTLTGGPSHNGSVYKLTKH